MSSVPFDEGLQAERTLLSWRRTSLSLAIGGLAAARLMSEAYGVLAVLIGVIALLLAAGAYGASTRRYRALHGSLSVGGDLPAGGLAIGLLTGTVATVAIASSLYLVAVSVP